MLACPQNQELKTLTPKPKQEDTLTELLDFVLANRGKNSFIDYEREKIEDIIRLHFFYHTLIFSRSADGAIDGILLWNVENWIPMRVRVCQIVGKGTAGKLLHKLAKKLPPSYEIYAMRRGGTKKIIYNAERTLALFRAKKQY